MKDKPFITEQHYAGIGRVLATWARLEQAMIVALGVLLGADKALAIVAFWHSGYGDKRDRLGALCGLTDLDKKQLKEFDCLITRMNAANDIRNTLAHSQWEPGEKPNSIVPFVLKARSIHLKATRTKSAAQKHAPDPEFDLPPMEFTPERLISEAAKIDRLDSDFRQFFSDNFGGDFFVSNRGATKDAPENEMG